MKYLWTIGVLIACGQAAEKDEASGVPTTNPDDLSTAPTDPDPPTADTDPQGDANTAPTMVQLILSPDPAHLHQVLTCRPEGLSDEDGDPVEVTTTWRVSGVPVAHDEPTINEAWFDVGDEVFCTGTPSDGVDTGDTLISNTVVILAPVDTGLPDEIPDCYGGLIDADRLGDGTCDFELNCLANTYDDGDCQTCAETGMTWSLIEHDAVLGVDQVGCTGCEPYLGDTACSTGLSVLCLEQTGAPNPGIETDYYHGWAQGTIQLSAPVAGCGLTSLDDANRVCELTFGAGWQIGDFHDGSGGWNWWAYGDLATKDRFWAYIDDQPANCWP